MLAMSFVLTLLILLLVLLTVKPLRRPILSRRILRWFRSVLPPISATEKAAIDAGTTWWDGELFSGRPNWSRLLAVPPPELTGAERAFLDGPVQTLCGMLDDWKINSELNDLPVEAWRFLKDERFFGMIIPEAYGGLEFSPRAQSEVVMKIATRSVAAAVTVMVPNSLGPGELLLHYGTDEQKKHYLPRLANGTEIPAFALTGPHAGSDAGAMPDVGVLCRGEHDGRETLGFRVNWHKRYITLGPVCTVLGLAFKAMDPDGLLGGEANLGITCALIPTNTPGVRIGERHAPGIAIQNGPNYGEDVFVPMDWIIGGQRQVGQGWKMLMNCLSVGRAISLPALGTAAGKLASLTTGAYASLRKQFGIPIGRFEGVEEALARIGGLTYRMDAARLLTASALIAGEQPSVLSAILKYHNTEGMRQVINDALDVHGGRGVCNGPANYLLNTYRAVPMAVTVEGANILTRSMIIFGQGAIRCHPYVLEEMLAVAEADETQGLRRFDAVFYRHIGHTLRNAARALFHGVTGARFARTPGIGRLDPYFRKLTRLSAGFAFLADIAMLKLGGELKRRERLSARFGDILSHLYFASAVLKRFRDEGEQAPDWPLAQWSLDDSLHRIDESIAEILNNFPSRGLSFLLRIVVQPLGRRLRAPGDATGQQVASLLLKPSATRDRLTEGVHIELRSTDRIGLLELALAGSADANDIEGKIRASGGHGKQLTGEGLRAAVDAGAITDLDRIRLEEHWQLVERVIAVDAFDVTREGDRARGEIDAADYPLDFSGREVNFLD